LQPSLASLGECAALIRLQFIFPLQAACVAVVLYGKMDCIG